MRFTTSHEIPVDATYVPIFTIRLFAIMRHTGAILGSI